MEKSRLRILFPPSFKHLLGSVVLTLGVQSKRRQPAPQRLAVRELALMPLGAVHARRSQFGFGNWCSGGGDTNLPSGSLTLRGAEPPPLEERTLNYVWRENHWELN